MRKLLLFCLIAIMFLSIATLAVAPKHDLTKPYTPTRYEWLDALFEDFCLFINNNYRDDHMSCSAFVNYKKNTIDAWIMDFIKERKGVDKRGYKANKEYFVKGLMDLKNHYEWSKDIPIKLYESTHVSGEKTKPGKTTIYP